MRRLVELKLTVKGAAHLWGLFFHHFFSFRNFYFTISSFLHYVVWLLKYKSQFFWKILVTPRWIIAGRMVNNFFLVGTISHVWMIWRVFRALRKLVLPTYAIFWWKRRFLHEFQGFIRWVLDCLKSSIRASLKLIPFTFNCCLC